MKKTLRTVVTAAMFAAANLASMPAVAEDNVSEAPAEAVVESSSEDSSNAGLGAFNGQDWNKKDEKKPKTTTTSPVERLVKTTNTTVQMVYGPKPTTALVETSIKTTTVTPQTDYGIPFRSRFIGDLNMDGSVDSFDMIALRRMLVKGEADSFHEEQYGDINHDGVINIADMVKLQQFLLGKLEKLSENGKELSYITDIEIEKITDPNDNGEDTIEPFPYDPREDIVISLYGIRPSKEIIDQTLKDSDFLNEEQQPSEDKD